MIYLLKNIFTNHPSDVEQTYFQHMMFSLRLSFRGGVILVAGIFHGVFPFLFEKTARNNSYKNINDIENRLEKIKKNATLKNKSSNTETIKFIDLATQKDRIKDSVISSLHKTVDSCAYIQGQALWELEDRLTEYTGSKNAIGCSSGTDAILLALMALSLEPGDAILIPSFGFVAAAEVSMLLNFKPVFIDSDINTFNIRVEDVEKGYDESKKKGLNPKAVVAINTYGLPCDFDSLNEFCKEKNLFLIEDCAQSFGATFNGKKSGNLADISCTSFFPSKPLGCYGDGGAVFTNDTDLASKIRSKLKHGQTEKYTYTSIGINGRLDTVQAAVLLEKMKIFDEELQLREEIASYYTDNLDPLFEAPQGKQNSTPAWAQYTLRHKNRDKIIKHLNSNSIPTSIHYPRPLHTQEPYRSCMVVPTDCTNAYELCKTVFSIPMHPYLKREQQNTIINALNEAV